MKNSIEQLNDIELAVEKIKVNTLYLKLIDLHNKAINVINDQLVISHPPFKSVMAEEYDNLMKEIAKIRLQILFLKDK